MLKKMSLSFKLIGSFFLVSLILLFVGIVGYRANESAGRHISEIKELAAFSLTFAEQESAHLKWYGDLSDIILNHEQMRLETDYHKCAFGKWYYGGGFKEIQKRYPDVAEEIQKLEEPHKQLHLSAIRIQEYLKAGDWEKASLYFKQNSLKQLKRIQEHFKKGRELLEKRTKDLSEKVGRDQRFSNLLILLSIVGGVFLALFLGILITRSIVKPVNEIVSSLRQGADSTENASRGISSSAQSLSGGASELASSIEEMTSSLEELQSIIETTSKNVNESELMMQETVEGVSEVSKQMDRMKEAMGEISGNNKQIGKIIKVIDDIAFQTNILALNAAVEAARAGEAGAGFAVVAEQVKSLAQKSAEAAKETADLIDAAFHSTELGEKISDEVLDSQKRSAQLAEKVQVLLKEINQAAKEETKGANQITQAVTQINTVVQNTASSSEELAASGEELMAQAETLKGYVFTLNEVVSGQGKELKQETKKKEELPVKERRVPQATQLQLSHEDDDVEIVHPDDVIPMDDFKDF